MKKLKIIFVGPLKCGKSTIANFLSEAIDYTIEYYRPTPGIRILEYELHNNRINTEVELWDCSGDEKYESLWPVFSWNVQGVVLVYNPEEKDHLIELERLYEYFVAKNMLPSSNVLIIANYKDTEQEIPIPDLSGQIAKLSYLNINIMDNSDDVRRTFENFVANVQTDIKDCELEDLGLLEN